jgi:uncharacterized membrane protein
MQVERYIIIGLIVFIAISLLAIAVGKLLY